MMDVAQRSYRDPILETPVGGVCYIPNTVPEIRYKDAVFLCTGETVDRDRYPEYPFHRLAAKHPKLTVTELPRSSNWVKLVAFRWRLYLFPKDGRFYLVSHDGQTWEERPLPAAEILDVAASTRCLVVLDGRSQQLLSTQDGELWTRGQQHAFRFPLNNIVHGDGRFVALTRNVEEDGHRYTTNLIQVSNDGEHWHKSHLPLHGNWNQLFYEHGHFFVLSDTSPTWLVSTDGYTWSEHSVPESGPRLLTEQHQFISVIPGARHSCVIPHRAGWETRKHVLPCAANWTTIGSVDHHVIFLASDYTSMVYSRDAVDWDTVELPRTAVWKHLIEYRDNGYAVSDDHILKIQFHLTNVLGVEQAIPGLYIRIA